MTHLNFNLGQNRHEAKKLLACLYPTTDNKLSWLQICSQSSLCCYHHTHNCNGHVILVSHYASIQLLSELVIVEVVVVVVVVAVVVPVIIKGNKCLTFCEWCDVSKYWSIYQSSSILSTCYSISAVSKSAISFRCKQTEHGQVFLWMNK